MWKRFLHRWGWAAMRRAGVTSELVDVVTIDAARERKRISDYYAESEEREAERRRQLNAAIARFHANAAADAAAMSAARAFANCLVNGLHIAGPGEPQ